VGFNELCCVVARSRWHRRGLQLPHVGLFSPCYRHDYLENIYSVSSTFLDGGLGSFITRGPRFSPDSVVAGVGVNADVTRNISVSFNYNAEANSDFIGNLFTLGLKYKF
jgi:outer membrane autotransporter protein